MGNDEVDVRQTPKLLCNAHALTDDDISHATVGAS
jgi:hypothetical protein